MTSEPALRPTRGGFLRPFGCARFIRAFLLGRGPEGSITIDPRVGAPQADIFYHYKTALLRATAMDRATRAVEKQARREGRPIEPDEIERLTEQILTRLPYKTRFARYHSFVVYFHNLIRLRWVEPTGQEEPSAFQTHYPPGSPRRYYRLTAKGVRAPAKAWVDPLVTLYGPRKPYAKPPAPPPQPPAPVPVRRPEPAAKAKRPAPPTPPPPPAPPVALGPPETAPREIQEIWERSLAEVKRDYPIGHPSLKAEAERAGVSQEEAQKIIAHEIYIERRRKVLEAPPPPPAAPARPPTAIPAFTVAPKPSRAAAQRLIAHLRKVEKVGLVWPEVTTELERLAGEVSRWAELVGEARDEEDAKDNPNEDRLDTLQDRLEALERAAEELEAGGVDDAIGTLDDAWPKPARAG